MAKLKVLICGASGFIGRNVTERFVKNSNCDVFAVYHTTTLPTVFSNHKNLAEIQADLTAPKDVARIVRGMDIVIQAAATTSGAKDIVTKPYYHVTDNAVMNSLIFRACYEQAVKHVIFFSCNF